MEIGWYEAICQTDFDIEQGPILRHVLPEDTFSEKIKRCIADLAMTDTNVSDNSTVISKHVFTVERQWELYMKDRHLTSLNALTSSDILYCPTILFRNYSKTLKRGYEQRSLTVVTKLPIVEFWWKILAMVGPGVVESEEKTRERIQEFITQTKEWPRVNWGRTVNLKVLDKVFKLDVSCVTSTPFRLRYEQALNTTACIMSNNRFFYPDTGQALRSFLALNGIGITSVQFNAALVYLLTLSKHPARIWDIFIHLLLEDPIVIYGDNIQIISSLVLMLGSLLYPLKYGGNIFPYCSIYHPCCDLMFGRDGKCNLSHCIVGLIDPYFEPYLSAITNGTVIWLTKGEIDTRNKRSSSKKNILGFIKGIGKEKVQSEEKMKGQIIEAFTAHKDTIKAMLGKDQDTMCDIIKGYFQTLVEELLAPLNIWFSLPPLIGLSHSSDTMNIPYNESVSVSKSPGVYNGIPVPTAIDKLLELQPEDCFGPIENPPIGPLDEANAVFVARKYFSVNTPPTLMSALGSTSNILLLFQLFTKTTHFKHLCMLQQPLLMVAKRELFDATVCTLLTVNNLINNRSKNSLKIVLTRIEDFKEKIFHNPSASEQVRQHLADLVVEIREMLEI